MRYPVVKTLALLLLGSALTAGIAGFALAADNGDDVVFSGPDEISLSSGEMKDNRGAFGISNLESDQALAAETTGNTLNVGGNLTNGTINLGDNLSAFGSYVMNTGNNSAINSAVAVNVQLAPVSP